MSRRDYEANMKQGNLVRVVAFLNSHPR